MKKILYTVILGLFVIFEMTSCQDMGEINTDPNNPEDVPSNMLFSGAQKKAVDYVYDNWFSGRQNLVYSQYWAQRNYTEEDRYQIRESTNNNYWNTFYTLIANFNRVILLNTDSKYAGKNAVYGNNDNQIAAARIMRAWLFSIMTDTWGSIPYSEVDKLVSDGAYYAKYDSQPTVYSDIIKELTEAVELIDNSGSNVAFTGGDMMFNGNAGAWKKFANSLKCRLAVHLSKVEPTWKDYITEALASGVFQSNADAAYYHYSVIDPEYCYFYSGFFIDGRNDFSITRPFLDILKGQRDTLNNKAHPWEGVIDPRMAIYTTPNGSGVYLGMPYGVPSNRTSLFRGSVPNWYRNPPVILKKDFPVPIMSFTELQLIISEYKGFSTPEYVAGVNASLDYWSSLAGVIIPENEKSAYVASVSANVTPEAVALQKYIDLFMNGTEAWAELRRTGYPEQLLRPGEISAMNETTPIPFTPLSDTKGDIVARVKYPTNESTLNGAAFNEAVTNYLGGENNYYTKMFWDVRTSPYDHPVNK